MALRMGGGPWASATTAGIALLIALPVLRVILMLIIFIREGDLRFSAIAMLVLAIIILGSVVGSGPNLQIAKPALHG
jgi:uncharacterized membrane protein